MSSSTLPAVNLPAEPNGMSKSELAHAYLTERITRGEYSMGERIVLGKVAEELGMSVVPVREAVRRLEAEGVVDFQKNVGATIASIDPEEYMHTMQTLGVVEAAATALSAHLITPEDLEEARRINEEMAAQVGQVDGPVFTELNARFHRILHSRCENPHLTDLVQRGWARLDRLRVSSFSYIPHRAAESVREHDRILRLIQDGASYAVLEEAVRMHRWNTLTTFQKALTPTGEEA